MGGREGRQRFIWGGALAGACLSLMALIPDWTWRLAASFVLLATTGAVLGTVLFGLKRWSFMDHATGLYNRRHFVKQLQAELVRSQRQQRFFCLASMDIVDFKVFNDRYGHLTGDKGLKSFSQLAQEGLRRRDTLAGWRWLNASVRRSKKPLCKAF